MTEQPGITAWSIKYWETMGVERFDDWEKGYDSNYFVRGGGWAARHEKRGRTVFSTFAEAATVAEKKRMAKIESVKKKLVKLEDMTFEGNDNA